MIKAAFVRAVLQTEDEEVPLKDVVFLRNGNEVREVLSLHDLFVLRGESAGSCHIIFS